MASGIQLNNSNGGGVRVNYSDTTPNNYTIQFPAKDMTVGELDKIATATLGVINLNLGNIFTYTVTGAITFSITGAMALPAANTFAIRIINGGSAIMTWWSGMKWSGGIAPTFTTSGTDILTVYSPDGGTTWEQLGLQKDVK